MKMKNIFLVLLMLMVFFNLSAQNTFKSEITFGANSQNAVCSKETIDNGYIMCGSASSIGGGNYDGFLIKLDSLSNLKWSTTVGGTGDDHFYSVIQNSDGDYIAVGNTDSYGTGSGDIYIAKLSSSGAVSWAKTIGSIESEAGYGVIQVADGGYIICGSQVTSGGTFILITKIDPSGNFQWAETISNIGNDSEARSIINTNDNGFVIAGSTDASNTDMYIAKFNSLGTLLWTRTISGANLETTEKIIETSDGGLAVVGTTNSYGAGDYDAYIVKLSNTGLVEWTRTIGTTSSETGSSIIQVNDGGYIITGGRGIGASACTYLAKINIFGTLLWSLTSSANDWGNSITNCNDGGFAIVGGKYTSYPNSEIIITKFDSLNSTCNSNFSAITSTLNTGGTFGTGGAITTLTLTNGLGGITGTGGTLSTVCLSTGVESDNNDNKVDIYPNPTTGEFTLKSYDSNFENIEVYNAFGELVYISSNFKQQMAKEINLANEPSGIYFIKLQSKEKIFIKKIVIL